MPRWQHLKKLTGRIEHAGTKYSKTHPLGLVTEENDDFRIRLLRQSEMRAELERQRKTVKWGRFLRAPDLYFDFLKHGSFCLLRELAMPKRGGMTRINEFFHVSPEVASKFKIEQEYRIPIIKSPKETNAVKVDSSELNLRIFSCSCTKAELKNLQHTGALSYIEWGENQRWPDGTLWKDGKWLKNRKPGWWSLPNAELTLGQVFFAHAYGDRHIQRYCPRPIVVDHNLYYLSPSKGVNHELLAAVLNSSLTALMVENAGRLLMGDGVLKLMVEEARDYLEIPDITVFSNAAKQEIADAFKPVFKRPILSVFQEIQSADRKALDEAVLRAVGLNPKKYVKPLYEALCDLVRERIELGKARGKERKTRARATRAEKQVAESVLDEIVPQGPKRFPDEFFSTAAAGAKRNSVALPQAELRFDDTLASMEVHTQDESFARKVKNPAEAKFLIYAQRAGQTTAELPQEPVEVSRTVANYEKYLRDLRKQLYEAYYRRTLDHTAAARLTQTAFERFRLPAVGER